MFFLLFSIPVLTKAQAPAIDGDPSDWPGVFTNPTITVKNFTIDSVNSSLDDIFTNGSADIDPIANWAWTNSGANDKNDMHSVGIANIGTRVYFFADRFSNNGDAAIGIWIMKAGVGKMAGGSFTGAHTNGDVLVISHFVNGGTVSDRKAFVWTNGVLVEDTSLTLADFSVAVNAAPVAAPAAWNYVPKSGPAGTYPANSFFEGYIDLASSNLSLDICFSSFIIETRNSQSINASLEDLVSGAFNTRPLSQTTTGSSFCSNSPVGTVTMNGSETGISYQLKLASNNSNVQSPKAGTGAPLVWTGLAAGSYYIVATNTGSNCETTIGNPTVVILNAVPAAPGTTGAARCGPGTVVLSASGGADCDSLIWFSDAGLTTRVNVGTSFSPNLSSTTTYWVICKSTAGCTSGATTVIGTVNGVPNAPSTTGASRCGAGIVALSASGGANCDSLIWFSDAGLTTRVNVGPNFSPNISSTTTYWVICKSVNGCTSSATTVIGTVNPVPSAPSTTGASRCGTGTVTLSASGGANCDSLIWFSDAGLTTRVNVGPSFSPNISSTTTYWVICKSVNGCTSSATTVIGTVHPVPSAPSTTGASRCGTGTVTLSASGGANCDSLIWFSDAGLTNRVNVGASFSPNISSTTTYWVICKSVNGCTSSATTVIGTVHPIPSAPSTTGASRCGPGTITLSASGGANCDSLIWFSDAGLTNRVNVGPSFSPNLSSTTTYWVICKSVNGCTSSATTVVGTVNPGPNAPSTTGASRCGPGTVTLSASGGANCDSLIWFSDAALTNRVNVGPSFSPNLSNTTTYWVICKSASGCTSSATTVIGTIHPIPSAPSTTGASRCGTGTVTLSASGGANCDSLIWFSDAGLTNRVNVGPSFSPNLSSTTTYWVICKSVNGCTSGATTVIGTIHPIPSAPSTTGASRCGPGTVTLSASGGANCDSLIWFSDAGLTNRVNVGPSFSPNISSTTTYWVICKSVNGCTSSATTVVGTINPGPNAPSTTGASRCGAGTVTLSASGGANCDSLIWFSNAGLTNRVNVGPSFSPNISSTTTYWVICKSVNGCTSSATTVIGTIHPVPSAPSTTGASRCGAGAVSLSASGGANCDSLIWFSNAGLTNRVNVGPSFSPNLSSTTTYWVICKSVNGCTSGATTVVGTVNPVPSAPSTTGASRCGAGTVTLNASGGANCDSLIWFSNAALTNRVHVGASFSPNLSSTTTYWVICKSVNGCTSSATTVIGTIHPVPSAPSTTGASRCGAGVVSLSASGGANCDSLIWFSDAGLTNRVNVGASFSPNLSSTTTYWVICKSVNGCTSGATAVIGTIHPVPGAPTTVSASRCGPGEVTLSASGGANCDSLIWFSDAGLTNRVHVGASFTPNVSSSTSYWVICKSVNGCTSAPEMVVAEVLVCDLIRCTYTQGYYGNTNGNSCDGDTTWQNPVSLLNSLLTTDLVIGNGGKSVLVPAGAGATLNSVMPGSKTPKALLYNGQCVLSTTGGSCFATNYLTLQGKINNVLLSQTITLALNVRMQGGGLLSIPIDHGYLTTQQTSGCGDSAEVVPCTLTYTLAISQYLMNENVVNYLTNYDAQPATVADLLALAHDVLGGALVPGQPGANGNIVPAYADVNAAVDAINRGFDKCRLFLGYDLPLCPEPLLKMSGGEDMIQVYPNPGDGSFNIVLPAAFATVKMAVLDLNGKVVYEKAWNNNNRQTLKLDLTGLSHGMYLLEVNSNGNIQRTKLMINR